MRALRLGSLVVAALMAFALLERAPARAQAAPRTATDRVWFSPAPGSIDYLQLFARPDEWAHARALISVFKIYQQHTQTPAADLVGPNTYDALSRAGAFRLLASWKIKLAIEAGSVKEFYCTPDASGMNRSIANTLDSIRAAETAGGRVAFVAMDEPFVSGRATACGGPALEPTADRVATYVSGVKASFPNVGIGLIEAYPFSSADAVELEVRLLQARGAMPAFLHMDVDWHLSGAAAFTRDMGRLQSFAGAQKIPFGIIITGYNGNADPLYAVDAYGITDLIARTFPTWNRLPDHLIFQSWATTDSGLAMTPANLDDQRVYSHTSLVRDIYRRLRGMAGASTGTAIPKTR